MQGNGERDGQILFSQLVDFINQTAGGKRNMAQTDADTVFVRNQTEKTDDLVIIVEWFTDAHHDYAGETFASEILLYGDDFPQNFSCGKVADSAADGGRTETASHSATDLGGNADCVAMLVFHDNRFHARAVLHFQKVLDSAVNGGYQFPADGGEVPGRDRCQPFACGLSDVGHHFRGQSAMQLRKNLFCSVFRFSD
ncbi:unknown [Clostridium sp. CAG:448]|nr:unknown [Clostridium sp. CAG:448]